MIERDESRLLLRIPEAAQRLGLGRSTVYELIAAGELPVVKIGKAVRIPASRLTAWVEDQASAAERAVALGRLPAVEVPLSLK